MLDGFLFDYSICKTILYENEVDCCEVSGNINFASIRLKGAKRPKVPFVKVFLGYLGGEHNLVVDILIIVCCFDYTLNKLLCTSILIDPTKKESIDFIWSDWKLNAFALVLKNESKNYWFILMPGSTICLKFEFDFSSGTHSSEIVACTCISKTN